MSAVVLVAFQGRGSGNYKVADPAIAMDSYQSHFNILSFINILSSINVHFILILSLNLHERYY